MTCCPPCASFPEHRRRSRSRAPITRRVQTLLEFTEVTLAGRKRLGGCMNRVGTEVQLVWMRDGRSEDEGCRSEEHTSELQSHLNIVCRLLLEKKKTNISQRCLSSLPAPIDKPASSKPYAKKSLTAVLFCTYWDPASCTLIPARCRFSTSATT